MVSPGTGNICVSGFLKYRRAGQNTRRRLYQAHNHWRVRLDSVHEDRKALPCGLSVRHLFLLGRRNPKINRFYAS